MNVIKPKPELWQAWGFLLEDHPLYIQSGCWDLKYKNKWFSPILARANYSCNGKCHHEIKISEKATVIDVENIKDIATKLEKLTGTTVDVYLPWNHVKKDWYQQKEEEIAEILEGLE
jgi:hypothetical protein